MKITISKRILKILAVLLLLPSIVSEAVAQNELPQGKGLSLAIAPPFDVLNGDTSKIINVDFVAEDTVVYVNSTIKFHNLSTGGATFFKWTFPGGVPENTYHSDPTIMFYAPGFYDVTLQGYGMSGNSTVTKEKYIKVLEVETGLPPGWDYNNTPSQQIIAIPFDTNPRIFEAPLDSGDFIGVFYYDIFNQLQCAGATQWTGTGSEMIVANGNDAFTPMKDGFYPGETINWKIHSIASGEDFPAKVSWDSGMPIQEVFIPNGISALTDIYAGVVYDVELQAGWSALSSPVEPWYKSLEALFGDAIEHVAFMSNPEGIFYPAGNVNTIGDWQNKGYFVKMHEPATIQIKGYPIEQTALQIDEGWNLIPVFVDCEVELSALLQNYSGKIEMVKEVAGLKSYIPDSEIFTLEHLQPGKAYLLQAVEPFALQFDNCP